MILIQMQFQIIGQKQKHFEKLLANALDESRLTNSKPIECNIDVSSIIQIRDFGRGINIDAFAQNINAEKE